MMAEPEIVLMGLFMGEPEPGDLARYEIAVPGYQRSPTITKIGYSDPDYGMVFIFEGTFGPCPEDWEFDHMALISESGAMIRTKDVGLECMGKGGTATVQYEFRSVLDSIHIEGVKS
jgi:hypothetical protein